MYVLCMYHVCTNGPPHEAFHKSFALAEKARQASKSASKIQEGESKGRKANVSQMSSCIPSTSSAQKSKAKRESDNWKLCQKGVNRSFVYNRYRSRLC